MNLLLSRGQTHSSVFSLVPLRVGSGVVFMLQAELELDEEEAELVKKYKFTNAPLIVSNTIEDLWQAFRPALFLGIATFILSWSIFSLSTGFSLGLLVTLAMTVVYFRTMRDQIIVRDLLGGGRTFRCDSIVALIQKEAFLENICEYLRQVLESAKHWDDRETIPIQPLEKNAAKQLVRDVRRD